MSLKIEDAQKRSEIEAWTLANTFPNVIKFIENKAGEWVTGDEVLRDNAYKDNPYLSTELSKAVLIAPNPKDSDVLT